ncbi:sulfurtransferase [Roseiflexus sp.]|uniref:sulfurtransferase n=1 Tax=Roseiflexus sp. TaxID=2562120 RepID=UPI00398A8420
MTIESLVSPAWLAERLNNPNIRVADLRWHLLEQGRGRAEYLEAHIPGAVYLDIDTDLAAPPFHGPGRHPIPSSEAFAAVASRAGIGPTTHVVAYDSVGGAYAARLWWLLRYFGHERVSLLDGGWPAWITAGLPVESGEVWPPPAVFTPRPNRSIVVDADAVETLRQDPRVLILDVRAAERYQGIVEPLDPRAGHIPGAISAPYADNVDTDGRMLSAEALQARYAALGADRAETIVCYCGSGVTAAHTIFALERAGWKNTLLYEGSWSDWSRDRSRPVATGPEPAGGDRGT